jgi:hypothetical protein
LNIGLMSSSVQDKQIGTRSHCVWRCDGVLRLNMSCSPGGRIQLTNLTLVRIPAGSAIEIDVH